VLPRLKVSLFTLRFLLDFIHHHLPKLLITHHVVYVIPHMIPLLLDALWSVAVVATGMYVGHSTSFAIAAAALVSSSSSALDTALPICFPSLFRAE
jgi:hypothetical protein